MDKLGVIPLRSPWMILLVRRLLMVYRYSDSDHGQRRDT